MKFLYLRTTKNNHMKQCTNCSNMLAVDTNQCNVCNALQTKEFQEFEAKPKQNDAFLKVLCILTIIGACSTLISVPFSLTTTTSISIKIPIYINIINVILAIGKLTGAIFMLRKKLTGLYIYTVAAISSLFVTIYSMLTMGEVMNIQVQSVNSEMQLPIVMISIIFSLILIISFLVMYWLPVSRKVLS